MKREDLYTRSFRGEDGFDEFVRSLGGDPVAVTKASGLAPSLPKGLVNFESFAGTCALFEAAAAHAGEPYFGLKWAFHQPSDFRLSGPNVFLINIAKNTRQWVDMAIDYQKIGTNGLVFSYKEDVDANSVTGVVAVHPLAPPCRQFLEHAVAAIALMGRQFVPGFKFNLITFQHSAPEDMTLYDEAFECPVVFNADRNTMVADHHYLAVNKTDFLTGITKPIVKQYMNWMLAKYPKSKQSIVMIVAETIPIILGVKGSGMKQVSQALGLHPKKLQRLLADEGETYSSILDQVRQNISARLLEESDVSIQRIAKMLDYSSDRAYTAAAKRWFGMPPSEYRVHARKA